MSKRKTVDVASLVEDVNRMLAAEGSTRDGRVALAVLIESVLMRTGNYRGFGYLGAEFEQKADGSTGLRREYDDTRRHYYPPR